MSNEKALATRTVRSQGILILCLQSHGVSHELSGDLGSTVSLRTTNEHDPLGKRFLSPIAQPSLAFQIPLNATLRHRLCIKMIHERYQRRATVLIVPLHRAITPSIPHFQLNYFAEVTTGSLTDPHDHDFPDFSVVQTRCTDIGRSVIQLYS